MTETIASEYQGASVSRLDDYRKPLAPRAITTPGLKGGGGGGTFDEMEARIASLEAHMLNARENIGLIRTDVRKAADDIGAIKGEIIGLKAKVDTLPTKEWGVSVILKLAAVISALYVIGTVVTVFAPKFMQPTQTVIPAPPAKP